MNPPCVLDQSQRALLTSALNRIIPARSDLPGAGDLDVGASIEVAMAESARMRRLFLDGLVEIALRCERQHHSSFVESAAPIQTEVLEDIEKQHPAFFVALVEHTYRGYYTLAAVHRAIGHDSRPPQPLGHRLPPFDPALLDRQRVRLPFWRRAEPD
jgi:hypothetical protein